MKHDLHINGAKHHVDADPAMPLLWVLRDKLALTGTKFGCGMAQCGACTVHLNGGATRACVMPVEAAAGQKVATIEGVAADTDKVAQAVLAAWVQHDVAQCGYCQGGQVMTAVAFLKNLPRSKRPSAEEIDAAMSGNLCRCGAYARIRAAVADAARALG
ncbi:(2Fe-2S)-binding protein [Roseateles sp. DC23W]|uniref:(2Fe-2S)-binding protein n=1 Tax=Pelomonas dachongensis TaxID=3299029 RepID=A0ABW7ENF4_9BURK